MASWLLPLVAVLFFFSGACALIYQVLWLRMLGWVFGVTVYAASTVWAVFMAGLAIGSIGGGRMAGRVRRPLAWFGVAEALVGLTAAATPQVLERLQAFYVSIYGDLPQSPAAMTLARFVMSAMVLLPPTILMGTTLPLLVRSSLGRSRLGARVGLLYGMNTAGAIAGTIAAGLWLIPVVGLRGSFRGAAVLNIAIGAGAVVLSWIVGPVSAPVLHEEAAPDPDVIASDLVTPRARQVVLLAFVISGFASLALEVVWFRLLVLFVRPTVYTFSLMLATVLTGIAIGSWAVAPWLKRRVDWLTILAVAELTLAILVLLSFAPLPHSQATSESFYPLLKQFMPDYLPPIIVTSVIVMLPSALVMGAAFPIGVKLWTERGTPSGDETERLGVFYALNVCGAIVGSLVTGFLLLPAAGSRSSLRIIATTILVSGLGLVAVSPARRIVRLGLAGAATVLFAVVSFRLIDPMTAFITQRFPGETMVWLEEGVQSTVSVHQFGKFKMETMDGIHQASDTSGQAFIHHRIGQLPMAIHPNPHDALVVGLGGGATAGAVGLHTGVNVDVVELSPAVVHAARQFEKINYGVLTRPNVHLRVDDGRNHLMLTKWRYDVITADIILPIHAGSTNVYSREYFELTRRALNPGGLVAQWVDGTEAEYKMIMRTFLSVFPYATLWADGSVLIGSTKPLRISRSDFEWKLGMPDRALGFRDVGLASFDDLVKLYTAGPTELARFVGDGPLLTDDRPMVEYFLSLPRNGVPDRSLMRRDPAEILAE